MNCDELRPEYGAFALGVAEDPERGEIIAHLEQHCPECATGVRSALVTVTAMSAAVHPADPPKHLRKRLIAMVTRDDAAPAPLRSRVALWFPWALAAALALVLLSVALPSRLRKSAPAELSQARLDEILSILNDPVTKDVSFGDPAARGRFFVSANKGVVFLAAHLPAVDRGRTFEMWVIPAGGKPVPAGTFNALRDSTALYVWRGTVRNAAAMAISIEPEGGSAQPTTTPIIVSKL